MINLFAKLNPSLRTLRESFIKLLMQLLFLAINRNDQLPRSAMISEFTQINPLPGSHI